MFYGAPSKAPVLPLPRVWGYLVGKNSPFPFLVPFYRVLQVFARIASVHMGPIRSVHVHVRVAKTQKCCSSLRERHGGQENLTITAAWVAVNTKATSSLHKKQGYWS